MVSPGVNDTVVACVVHTLIVISPLGKIGYSARCGGKRGQPVLSHYIPTRVRRRTARRTRPRRPCVSRRHSFIHRGGEGRGQLAARKEATPDASTTRRPYFFFSAQRYMEPSRFGASFLDRHDASSVYVVKRRRIFPPRDSLGERAK